MNEQLNRELNKIDENIRQAVIDADEFLYSKLNRAKEENLQKQFFAETKSLRAELETLSESRQSALAVREDLTAELKEAADKVFAARSLVFDLEENHGRIANQIYFLDQKAEIDRQSIKDLSKRLETHINSKLNEVTTND
jgi:chromosome segregation ATPase